MDHLGNAVAHCCAECGEEEGGVSLKTCKSCMLVRYCNANCQRNHWSTHKQACKRRSAELRNEALFKDPPPKEDCPNCFLPMPYSLICCASLPPATMTSVPICDFVQANEGVATEETEVYFVCCGKSICGGCVYSCVESGSTGTCPFCKSERSGKTDEEIVEDLMKRVEANDAVAIYLLAQDYYHGQNGLHQDEEKAKELYAKAAGLGLSVAHHGLGNIYHKGGNLKKAMFHYEAAAMLGNEVARFNLACSEYDSGNRERAVKHCMIAASSGSDQAMNALLGDFELGLVSRNAINSTLTAYNNLCAEMRSEARDAFIRFTISRNGGR